MIVLFYLIILPIYQDALFDRVLKLRGLRHVLEANSGNDVAKCMRGVNGGLFILVCQVCFSWFYVCVGIPAIFFVCVCVSLLFIYLHPITPHRDPSGANGCLFSLK